MGIELLAIGVIVVLVALFMIFLGGGAKSGMSHHRERRE